MCGITGIFDLSGKNPFLKEQIIKATRAIRHRGPDDEGYLLFSQDEFIPSGSEETSSEAWQTNFSYSPKVRIESHNKNISGAFGFRRLSIIDLSAAGHQPMCTSDKKLWIIFNGEIYNYIELRNELLAKGYSFLSNTDTEVLLYAYKEWGESFLHKLNGMWAFAIYDVNNKSLFAARDRFGVKPFYYFKDSAHFAFASEQKALLTLPFIQKKINPVAVFDLFAFGKYERREEGFFENILELPPATILQFDFLTNSLKTKKYYELKINTQAEKFDKRKFNSYSKKTQELITEAVKIRLRADVPIGSCLSGGLDSSTIVCTVNKLLKQEPLNQIGDQQKVFTAIFDEQKYDESKWAKIVVDETKAEWHTVKPVKQDFLKEFETLSYCQEMPLTSISTYAQFKVLELARKTGVKVVMDGQGGDEIFAGYPHYLPVHWRELLKDKNYSAFFKELNTFGTLHSLSILSKEKIKSLTAGSTFNRYYFKDQQYLNESFYQKQSTNWKKNATENSLNEILKDDLTGTTLKHYLKCEDRSSMWHSLESRTPFSDDINLIEYVFNIPSVYKIHHAQAKYLMRNSVEDIVPDQIIERKDKKGFSTPNNEWITALKNELRTYITQDLDEFINVKKLLKDYDNFFELKDSAENYRMLKFFGFAAWKKVFNV